MPVVYPGNVQEVLDLGRHAIARRGLSGLWVALKIVTNVADAIGTVNVGPDRVVPVMPVVEYEGRPYRHAPNATLLAPDVAGDGAHAASARAWSWPAPTPRENGLNPITADPRDAWLGIVASGTAYYELREALRKLGVDAASDARHPPAEARHGLAAGARQIVRDVRPGARRRSSSSRRSARSLESQVKDVLYGTADAPRVLGKRDENGAPLIPRSGAVDADQHRPRRRRPPASARRRIELRRAPARTRSPAAAARSARPARLARTPFFCSGCPHNRSTAVPDGALVGAGIGCHTMVLLNPESKGTVTGLTQMGGEGAQWIGQAPFTDTPAHLPEPRRRHLPPLRLAGGPGRGRRGRQHHLQAALQQRGRDDRRPGRQPGPARCPS